jgi:RNase H-fold protein (predicted Holliday junction resolvase)
MHVFGQLMNSFFDRINRPFGAVVALATLVVAMTLAGTAYAKPMSEKEKIDALIQVVEARNDLQFIRLGEAHSASEAARVLRTKLWYAGSRVKTADEFIDHIAAATVSGSPYFIRYPDGKQVPSAEFLREELKRINQASASK